MNQHSPTRTSIDRQEVNRVLQLKRKQREARACYPCRQRKVKCDNGHPCQTCCKRGHPEICTYDIGSPSHGRQSSLERSRSVRSKQVSRDIGSPGLNDTSSGLITGLERNPTIATSVTENVHSLQSQVLGSVQSSVVHSPEETAAATDEGSKDYPSVYSGDNSVVSLLRSRTQDPNESMAREARSVLGLQNTCCSYPFMDLRTKQDRWMALLKILPQKEEVSRLAIAPLDWCYLNNQLILIPDIFIFTTSEPTLLIQFCWTWIILSLSSARILMPTPPASCGTRSASPRSGIVRKL